MLRTLLVALLILGVASAAGAALRDYSIALHIQDYYMDCDTHLANCWAINTWWLEPGTEIYVYVMVCGHGWAPGSDGFTAAWYGLTWPQGWILVNWQDCADWSVGAIQGPDDSIEQHWNLCVPPTGWPVTVGILTLIPTSPGQVKVTVHGGIGAAKVQDCHNTFDTVLPCTIGNGRAGWVSIGIRDPGCNPCPCVGPPCYPPPSGTDHASWGAVKVLYR